MAQTPFLGGGSAKNPKSDLVEGSRNFFAPPPFMFVTGFSGYQSVLLGGSDWFLVESPQGSVKNYVSGRAFLAALQQHSVGHHPSVFHPKLPILSAGSFPCQRPGRGVGFMLDDSVQGMGGWGNSNTGKLIAWAMWDQERSDRRTQAAGFAFQLFLCWFVHMHKLNFF